MTPLTTRGCGVLNREIKTIKVVTARSCVITFILLTEAESNLKLIMYDEEATDTDLQGKAQGFCHMNESSDSKSFSIDLLGKTITIEQDPSCSNKELGHGAVVWDAAVIFAKYLESSSKYSGNMQDTSVIELGAGCGLAGLTLLLKGAQVTFTDMAPVVKHMTTPNINRIYGQMVSLGSSSIRYQRPDIEICDWTETYPVPASPYDVCLLTDCVFSPTLAKPLVGQILRLTGPKSTILVCHEIRDEEANNAFLEEFGKHFSYKKIPRKKMHKDYNNELVVLLEGKPHRKKK